MDNFLLLAKGLNTKFSQHDIFPLTLALIYTLTRSQKNGIMYLYLTRIVLSKIPSQGSFPKTGEMCPTHLSKIGFREISRFSTVLIEKTKTKANI